MSVFYLDACNSSRIVVQIFTRFHTENLHETLSWHTNFHLDRTVSMITLRKNLSDLLQAPRAQHAKYLTQKKKRVRKKLLQKNETHFISSNIFVSLNGSRDIYKPDIMLTLFSLYNYQPTMVFQTCPSSPREKQKSRLPSDCIELAF